MAGSANLYAMSNGSKTTLVRSHEPDKDNSNNKNNLKTSNGALPVSAIEKETFRRPRGRPAGSRNKPKPPIILTHDSPNSLRAHAIEIASGCDILESLADFARRKQKGLCILSANGCVTNVTIRQPASSGATLTLHGRFEILSLVGSILPPPAPPGITGLSVYLAGAQGQVVGGGVVGGLIASGPVVIMAASFMNCVFDRLSLDEDEVVTTAMQNRQFQNRLHHIPLEVSDSYGLPQNYLTNGVVHPEIYNWATSKPMSKP